MPQSLGRTEQAIMVPECVAGTRKLQAIRAEEQSDLDGAGSD